MATAPIIRSSGSSSGVVTGQGRNDLDIGETVTFSDANAGNTGATYQWVLEDAAPDSTATLLTPTSATCTLVPDQTGSYRVAAIVNGVSYPATTVIVAVPLAVSGARMPSFGERGGTLYPQYNASGNTKGWHPDLIRWMRYVDGHLSGGGGGTTVKVSATDTTASYLDAKVTVTSGHLTKTKNNPAGNEVLEFGLPAVGPGAGTYGGSAKIVRSVVLDDQGRVINVTADNLGILPTGLVKVTTGTGALSSATLNADYAAANATYVVQTASNAPGTSQVLASLSTGIVKVTTSTGVLSTATASDIPSLLTTKGDLLGYTSVPARVAVGSDGNVLTADTASAAGWKWAAPSASGADALATYLVQTSSHAPANAQTLASLSTGLMKVTTTTGVVSTAVANTDYASPSATYIVQTSTAAPGSAQVLSSLATGILKVTTSTGVLSIAAASDLPSRLTTKGDLEAFSTVPTRLGVGTDTFVLTADSTAAVGFKWAAASGGANALGTYVVQTSTNAPANAQVLASLATGFAKITTSTGVVSTQATIAGSDLSGFTSTRVPFSDASGHLTDSAAFTYTDSTKLASLSASLSGATVKVFVQNSSNTASSGAMVEVAVAGSSATGNPIYRLTAPGTLSWDMYVDVASGGFYRISAGGNTRVTVGNQSFSYQGGSDGIIQANQAATASRSEFALSGSAGGATATFTAYGNTHAATVFGIAAANKAALVTPNDLLVGSTGAHDVVVGANNVEVARFTSAGNFSLFGATTFGGGVGVEAVKNATTAPTSAPTSSVIRSVESGRDKIYDPSGVVTILN